MREFRNLTLGFIVGVLFIPFLGVLRLFGRMKPPAGPVPPPGSIIYWSHTHVYLQQIDPIFLDKQKYSMVYLGDHSLLSYIWYPWHLSRGFWIFRPQELSELKPFHQIVEFLNQNPELSFGIMTDSGGPYGKVRSTILGLSLATHRPLVALRLRASHFFEIHKHKIPLLFAKVRSEWSQPVYPNDLKNLDSQEALAVLQRLFEGPIHIDF